MDDCVFCKIVRREIPAEILYEDADTLAFLDARPTTDGHSLVIPKKHIRNIFDADDASLAAAMAAVRKVSPAVRDSVGAKGLHINSNHESAAGQIVFHLHFHVIPRHDRSEFQFWPQHEEPKEEAAAIAAKIRSALSER
jgi:histidine triad (HIT) family protein